MAFVALCVKQIHSWCMEILVRISLNSWHRVSDPFTMYDNNITHIVTLVDTCLKSIHAIHASYVTSNTYFVTLVIPCVNTFVMPGVNYIYGIISYRKFNCICINILNSLFISKL